MTKAMSCDIVADSDTAGHPPLQNLLRKSGGTASKAELRSLYGAFIKTMVPNYDTRVNPSVMSPDS
jgi:hypothetical protein